MVTSTDQIIQRLHGLSLSDNNAQDPWNIVAFDIQELYPSIDQTHMFEILKAVVLACTIFDYRLRCFLVDVI